MLDSPKGMEGAPTNILPQTQPTADTSMSTEESIREHYILLRDYLDSYIKTLANRQPSSAMARVGRLPAEQFFEVSNDLHDELKRRLDNPDDLPFLPIRADLLPKRNQARQKMATLPESRFKELAAELYVEIEKRFPNIISQVNERRTITPEPLPKPPRITERERSRRNNNEESFRSERRGSERDVRSEGGLDSNASGPRRTRRDQNSGRRDRDRSNEPPNRYPSFKSEESIRNMANNANTSMAEQEELAKIRSDYEFKIAMLEKQVKSAKLDESDSKKWQMQISKLEQANENMQDGYDRLQADYDRLKADYDRSSKDIQDAQQEAKKYQDEALELQDEFEREQKMVTDLENALIKTQEELKRYQNENAEQKKVIDKLRTEEASFLSDIQLLKDKVRAAESAREALAKENALLQDDLNSSLKSIPRPSSPNRFNDTKSSGFVDKKSPTFASPRANGVSPTQSIKTIRENENPTFVEFQKISSELIKAAKNSANRTLVLGPMKSILLTCKEITQDCEKMEDFPGIRLDDKKSLRETKLRLSECLTQLMSATKEHASNTGPSLVQKIEGELGNLSYCVSDILDLLKGIRNPSVPGGGNERDTLQSNGKADAPNPSQNGGNYDEPAMELPELKDYLKEQIDFIAHTIQDLLQAMLNTSVTGEKLSDLVNNIATCVDNIIYETQGTLDISPNMDQDVMADADDVVAILGDIRNELLDLGDDVVESPGDRGLKQKIANSSYEIAKHSKELLAILD